METNKHDPDSIERLVKYTTIGLIGAALAMSVFRGCEIYRSSAIYKVHENPKAVESLSDSYEKSGERGFHR